MRFFGRFYNIPDSWLSLFSLCVCVCTNTRQVEHQRCSRDGRVQKNYNILRKKTQYLMNTLYIHIYIYIGRNEGLDRWRKEIRKGENNDFDRHNESSRNERKGGKGMKNDWKLRNACYFFSIYIQYVIDFEILIRATRRR